MSRAVHPEGAGGSDGALIAWLIPAAAALVLLASTCLWAAAAVTSGLGGHGWPHTGWGPLLALQVWRTGGPAQAWPGVSTTAIVVIWIILTALVVVPLAVWAARKIITAPRSDHGPRSLATAQDIADVSLAAAQRSTVRLRASMSSTAPARIAPGDAGVVVGRLDRPNGPPVLASWEDVVLAVMAPRAGKTSALAIPTILAAPGPVVATSNKADLWGATAAPRLANTGARVWTFDPQSIARTPQTWWWDVLAGITTVEEAERLAGHFVSTVEDERSRDIWGPAATELLSGLLLAAALEGKDIIAVYRWLSRDVDKAPATALRDGGFPAAAASLAGVQGSAPETRASVYFTARAGAKCLRDPAITAWVTPGHAAEAFDPAAFVNTQETLYLLSKDGGGSAAPLVAALTDRVIRAGVSAANASPVSRRLDPPMVIVLDEAANVCRLADLPLLYSHLGSRGIMPVTILQSYPQGQQVWGDGGMKALWSAATIKLIGAGIDDPAFAEDISRLLGDHNVSTSSVSTGGRRTVSTSVRQQRIMSAADVRAIPKGSALMLATGKKPALIELLPFYTSPNAALIAEAITASEAALSAASPPAKITTQPRSEGTNEQ